LAAGRIVAFFGLNGLGDRTLGPNPDDHGTHEVTERPSATAPSGPRAEVH